MPADIDIWIEKKPQMWGFKNEDECKRFWDLFYKNGEHDPDFRLLESVEKKIAEIISEEIGKPVKVTQIDSEDIPGEFEYK